MEQKYWLRRKQAEMSMARTAASSQARLIHYELAGLCSVKAAENSSVGIAPGMPIGLVLRPKADAQREGRS